MWSRWSCGAFRAEDLLRSDVRKGESLMSAAARHVLICLLASQAVGCAGMKGAGGEIYGGGSQWCHVSVVNHAERPLLLRYYAGGLGTDEVVLGTLAEGASTEFSAQCSLETIRVLGYPTEPGNRTLVARTDEIYLDPDRRVRGILREVR